MTAANPKTKTARMANPALVEVPRLVLYSVWKDDIALPRFNILEPLISFSMIAHTRAEDARKGL
jgi:hypothetical protein